MNGPILVCGSIAEDLIGTAGEAEPGHPAVPLLQLQPRWGGCALNITFGLNLLDVQALPVATVGSNYAERLQPYLNQMGIDLQAIRVDHSHPGQATGIMISQAEQQLTFFHAGPSDSARHPRLAELPAAPGAKLVHVAPLAPATALNHLRDARALGVPTVFDPGQCLARFSGSQLQEALSLTDRLTLNADEWHLLQSRTGLSANTLRKQVHTIVVTSGAGPVQLSQRGLLQSIEPPAVVKQDETGCGDAFRAGYLQALLAGLDEQSAVQRGCCAGAACAQSVGAHHYPLSLASLAAAQARRYAMTYLDESSL